MTEKQYGRLVKEMSPKSPVGRDCFNAFWIGGVICVLGQLLVNGYDALGLEKEQAGTAASMTLVALSEEAEGVEEISERVVLHFHVLYL